MSLLNSQIEERAQLDNEKLEHAYAELANSVISARSTSWFIAGEIEQVDKAAIACLKYINVAPGKVPEGITDIDERLNWLCRPTGTMQREVALKPGWQKKAFGAMLAHLDTGETVALLPRAIRGYYYIDPQTQRKVRVTNEVARHISNEAILFYRPMPAHPLTVRDLVTFIFHVFDRSDYLLVLFAALAVTLIGLAPAWANQLAFGVVAPSGQTRLIFPIAALLLGVAVSSSLISTCRNLVMGRLSTKLQVIVQAATFSRILALPSSFFKEYSSGNLASRIATVQSLTEEISSILLGTGLSAVLSIIYVFQIAVYAPSLALPALLIAVVQSILMVLTTLRIIQYNRKSMEASAKLSGEVTALLNGIQKIKLAGAENRAFAKWASNYADYARPTYNIPAPLRALPAIVALVGLLGTIFIYYAATISNVGVPEYMAFNAANGQMTAAISALAAIVGQVAQIRPMLDMVAPILEATPEVAEDKPSVESINGGVEISGVSFRYNENQPNVLNNLSLKIEPGEYVALVGESGCGKSTVLRLLLGFEQADSGSILYGPYDVTKVNLQSLRQHIGVVMQDGKLFMGSLSSNITISAPSATLDDAWEAAEIAGIADDIRKMPMGMQTLVTEGGGGISGGQRQRLMIARAICRKPSILILDEATSALDNKTQKHVTDSLDQLHCTRIVVAHRLSTVRHCDRILVVNKGTIAEEGTYEELIEKSGIFADLVARQRLDTEE